eukprot:939270-Pyramimonas_sp.AAC.1
MGAPRQRSPRLQRGAMLQPALPGPSKKFRIITLTENVPARHKQERDFFNRWRNAISQGPSIEEDPENLQLMEVDIDAAKRKCMIARKRSAHEP